MFDNWMTDPTVVSAFDPALQDVLGNVSDISAMVDDIVDSAASAPGDVAPAPAWAPPVWDGMPDISYPDAVFVPDLIHPDEFALNGFPYQGQDPTEPGYWSPPSF